MSSNSIVPRFRAGPHRLRSSRSRDPEHRSRRRGVGAPPAGHAAGHLGRPRTRLDAARSTAPVPARGPVGGRDRHRSTVRRGRRQAHLRRQPSAEGRGDTDLGRASDGGCRDARHRPAAHREGRDVVGTHGANGRALPALLPSVQCDAHVRDAVSARGAAGSLELRPETSPPVLERIPGWRGKPYARTAAEADARFDVIRGYLRFFGPPIPRQPRRTSTPR